METNRIRTFLTATKRRFRDFENVAIKTLPIFFDAHHFIIKNKFYHFLISSGLFFLLFFGISIKGLLYAVSELETPFLDLILPIVSTFVKFSEDEIRIGVEAIFWLINQSIKINQDAIFSTIFLVLGTPFFSFISAKTEEYYTGITYRFQWKTFRKEVWRGLRISFKNSIKQGFYVLLLTLFSFIPILGMWSPLLIFCVQAYFNGILMIDYTLERKGISVKSSMDYYQKNKAALFALGLGFMFLLLIPVIGWFLAPTYALVASFLHYEKTLIKK